MYYRASSRKEALTITRESDHATGEIPPSAIRFIKIPARFHKQRDYLSANRLKEPSNGGGGGGGGSQYYVQMIYRGAEYIK